MSRTRRGCDGICHARATPFQTSPMSNIRLQRYRPADNGNSYKYAEVLAGTPRPNPDQISLSSGQTWRAANVHVPTSIELSLLQALAVHSIIRGRSKSITFDGATKDGGRRVEARKHRSNKPRIIAGN